MKFFARHGLKVIGAILLVLFVTFSTPQGKNFAKTVGILYKIASDPIGDKPNSAKTTSAVKEVSFQSRGETVYGDLWLPKDKGKHKAAVLDLGINIDRQDQSTKRLAKILSEAGFVILVPNSPSLGARRLQYEAEEDLIASFEFLESQPQVEAKKTGFIGFCASGGLTVLAAEDEKIADRVDYVLAISPYYDLFKMYEEITTRQIEDNGSTLPWQPFAKTVEILNRETIDPLSNETDKQILESHLLLIDQKHLESANYDPLSAQDSKKLSKEGQLTWDILTNKDPAKAQFYKEQLTDSQKYVYSLLSPKTDIAKLKAKTFIIADVNNRYIPYTEAKSLAKATRQNDQLYLETKLIPAGTEKSDLPLIDKLKEAGKMTMFMWKVLSAI